MQVLHRDGDEVVSRIRHLAREQLVEHDAEGVDVGSLVDLLALRLLGGDVVARPEDGARLRHALNVDGTRDAEVRDLGLALLGEEHVLRLDVSVHEPALVREVQRAGDLQPVAERLVDRQRAVREEALEVLALDVLEDDVLAAVFLAAVDDRDDVGMGQLRDRARLAPEALDVVLVGAVLLVQDLDGDGALEQPVVRTEDVGHASRAHELVQLVTARDQLTDHGAKFG